MPAGAVCAMASITASDAKAGDAAAAAEAMARALQDPLANLRMIATDNTIGFNAGEDDGETNYNFQLQPVYALDRPDDATTNMIARAVVPIIGIEPGAQQPPIIPDPVEDTGSQWGLGDTNLQFFISPKSDSAWKWGAGPQLSVPTHTNDRLEGPGWGLGLAGILVGNFTGSQVGVVEFQPMELGHSFEVLQPGVGDVRAGEIDLLEVHQRLDLLEPRVAQRIRADEPYDPYPQPETSQ